MYVSFNYDRYELKVRVPDDSVIYESSFPEPTAQAGELVLKAINNPLETPPLKEALKARRPGYVVIVVSDITRPIPYSQFLPEILNLIESVGVPLKEIVILVATGMHRPSTPEEKREMFGPDVMTRYRIIDHHAEHQEDLMEISGESWSGMKVRLNRFFVEAGFRIVTGLVEPHFMAGFSGGRKAILPGLASLDTIKQFHGETFLSNPLASNGMLDGNPCHEESLSVSRLVGVNFSLNVVLNKNHKVIRAFAGDIEKAHQAACEFVRQCACIGVSQETDVALTTSGGYPLDATFYQCVKGFVSCLPAIRRGGVIIAFGGCKEGIGGQEYVELLTRYANRWEDFLADIKDPNFFIKDQWQFQMHARALKKIGQKNLYFVTDGLSAKQLNMLSVNGVAVQRGGIQHAIQKKLKEVLGSGKRLSVFLEGPYCTPLPLEKLY